MMQIGTKSHIFLFDFFIIKQNEKLLEKIQLFLSLIMQDTEICKTFFDCRRDTEAMHKMLKCCVKNVFDVQAIHMLLKQWKSTSPLKNTGEIISPGLNTALKDFKASHGINENKEKMHEIFNEGSGTYEIRPLSLMFIKYAAKDVEDLLEIKEKMIKKFESFSNDSKLCDIIIQIMSRAYAEQGCIEFMKSLLPKIKKIPEEIKKDSKIECVKTDTE